MLKLAILLLFLGVGIYHYICAIVVLYRRGTKNVQFTTRTLWIALALCFVGAGIIVAALLFARMTQLL